MKNQEILKLDLEKEMDEIRDKYKKLENFISNIKTDETDLSIDDIKLLGKQLSIMSDYIHVLGQRLANIYYKGLTYKEVTGVEND